MLCVLTYSSFPSLLVVRDLFYITRKPCFCELEYLGIHQLFLMMLIITNHCLKIIIKMIFFLLGKTISVTTIFTNIRFDCFADKQKQESSAVQNQSSSHNLWSDF